MELAHNISLDIIRKAVTESNHPISPVNGSFQKASVLALFSYEKGTVLHFIKKADDTRYAWSGQMAFPGGHTDPEDNNRQETALRELKEEMGINKKNVEILGSIGHFTTIHNREIKVFIGIWNKKDEIVFDRSEISRVIPISLNYLVSHHIKKGFNKQKPDSYHLTYPFEDVVIWGATAKMIFHLIEILLPEINQVVERSHEI
ncbi:MAG: CoA pyrophosphatase [Desulfobacterales bacterium]|nr:CoA pyrophosphatase [Desulfobacterales bacterium]